MVETALSKVLWRLNIFRKDRVKFLIIQLKIVSFLTFTGMVHTIRIFQFLGEFSR